MGVPKVAQRGTIRSASSRGIIKTGPKNLLAEMVKTSFKIIRMLTQLFNIISCIRRLSGSSNGSNVSAAKVPVSKVLWQLVYTDALTH